MEEGVQEIRMEAHGAGETAGRRRSELGGRWRGGERGEPQMEKEVRGDEGGGNRGVV